MVKKELILSGLRCTKYEKEVQERLINAINEGNYTLAEFLTHLYDEVCNKTDEVAKKIVDFSDNNLMDLNEQIEDIACEKYGGNTSLGLSFSFIVSNHILSNISNKEIIESDSFGEEEYYIIHTLAIDKYLEAKDPKYKEEMLDHINNNISRSKSIRALFRGNKELFDKYNPELYYDFLELKRCGEDYAQIHVLTSCIVLEELYKEGMELFLKSGFSKKDTHSIINAQRDMEEIKLAGYYIQAYKRGYDLKLDYSKFSESTMNSVRKGFELGEKYKDRFKSEETKVKRK